MTEMFPRPTDFIQPPKSSAWLEKAKQLTITEKKIEIFNFKPESCVKLNNVEGARRLLDNMYNQMEADKISQVIEEHGPPVPEKGEKQRFLFTVKICIAEGLIPADGNTSSKLDTFVTLSDEGGNRLAKTRTVYETFTPRCTFLDSYVIPSLISFQGMRPLTFPSRNHSGSWLASATVP
jgi:hypothetical protein